MINNKKIKIFKSSYSWIFIHNINLILLWINIISLTSFLFISPTLGSIKINDELIFGFYKIDVLKSIGNTLDIFWPSIIFSILSIGNIILSVLLFWIYKNSSWTTFIKNKYLSSNLIIAGCYITIMLIVCFANIPRCDFKSLNLIEDGFSKVDGLIKFNLIFDYSKHGKDIWWQISNYGIAMIIFCVVMIPSIFIGNFIISKNIWKFK